MLALPNGTDGIRIGAGWLGYRVDLEHLNYFHVGNLARLLERCDLFVEHFWESGQPAVSRGAAPRGPARWLSELVQGVMARPAFNEGTFNLTVLARKTGVEPPGR